MPIAVTVSAPDHVAYGASDPPPDRVHGQDVLDAAYHVAHSGPGGIGALAQRMGVSANTLTHKVNPNNDTHHLSLREAVAMQELSGNAAILHAMAARLGYTCARALPDEAGGDPVEAFMHWQTQVADLTRATADALVHGGSVSPNEMRRAERCAQDMTAQAGHLLATLRVRMRKAPQ